MTFATDTGTESGAESCAPYMQIGEVAERTGLTQRTLRYYEAIGLLAPATRLEGGFRLYTEEDIRRLDQIVQLKRLLGFSLAEIRQIVEADETLRQIRQENKIEPDPHERRARLERALGILEDQHALVQSRIVAMRDLQASYERRLERIRSRLASIDSQITAGSTSAAAGERPPEPAAVG